MVSICQEIGIQPATGAAKTAAGVVYGTTSHEWMTVTMAPLFLMAVALLACWI
ncbi:MAG TPA: hypothetical protein VFE27_05800 [Acidobacteriaceae bacterium]|nr:hypothetical protein [Acidobacteriaceae bacterium]